MTSAERISLDDSQNMLNEIKENHEIIYIIRLHLYKIQKLTKVNNIQIKACVSPQTTHFRVLDKNPLSDPGTGPTSCNSTRGKEPPAGAGDIRDTGSTPESRRSPGGGRGNPLHYSCLENPKDGEAWRATVHGFAKTWTRLK